MLWHFTAVNKKGKTGSEKRGKNWFIKINWIKYENEFAYFIKMLQNFHFQRVNKSDHQFIHKNNNYKTV